MTKSLILDASAMLCLLNGEAGFSRVAEALPNAVVSAVNLSEVAAKLTDYGMDASAIADALSPLRLDVVAFDEQQALEAGALRASTRQAGLSFGDRACIALARQRGATALTADRTWAAVGASTGTSIETLR